MRRVLLLGSSSINIVIPHNSDISSSTSVRLLMTPVMVVSAVKQT